MRALLLAALALSLWSCNFDGSAPGVRGQCATPSADPLCEPVSLATPEDACWHLVDCGSIPVLNPDEQPDDFFDYPHCVRFFETLDAHRLELSLACMSSATCDELRFQGSPDRPQRYDIRGFPLCLEYGDQP